MVLIFAGLNFTQCFFARIKFRDYFEIAKIAKISKNKVIIVIFLGQFCLRVKDAMRPG